MLTYLLLRLFGFVIYILPRPVLCGFAKFLGFLCFYLHKPFRKKAMTNLAIAYGYTKSEREKKRLAIASFQSIVTTLLEFFQLKKHKEKIEKLVRFEENSEVLQLLEQKKGVIFFSGHQSNWEIAFLALTKLFRGIAIGKPIKNKLLYDYILSIREMNDGRIVTPTKAIRHSMYALKRGEFVGIVGDQAFTNSNYFYPMFGVRTWISSSPALLAYKTNCPIVVGITKRVNNHYVVSGSPPIWPDPTVPIKDDAPRMMNQAMQYLENNIKKVPEQWMWIHDQWKQAFLGSVKKEYRYSFILVVLPNNFDEEIVTLVRKIYPNSFITIYAPDKKSVGDTDCEVYHYKKESDLFQRDWRFQLVLDFYESCKLRSHFSKLGAFRALSLPQDKEVIIKTLMKPECQKTVFL